VCAQLFQFVIRRQQTTSSLTLSERWGAEEKRRKKAGGCKKSNGLARSASEPRRRKKPTSHVRESSDFLPEIAGKEMDVVEMVLMERATGIPLDLIILIRSFLYEKLTDANFFAAVELWFRNEEKCRLKFGHISDWNTSRVTNMRKAFDRRERFNEDLSRWNVSNVTNMSYMFNRASQFNGDLSQWDVSRVADMHGMFDGATQFNGDISQWNVSRVILLSLVKSSRHTVHF
jgi:surface protein